MKAVAIAVVLLAGCAVTPDTLREQGERRNFTSANPPAAVAECMARNAENSFPSLGTRIRPGDRPGTLEVLARSDVATRAFARIEPDGTGSRITQWNAPLLLLWERNIIEDFGRGC